MLTARRAAFVAALLLTTSPALAATAVTGFTGGFLNNPDGDDLPFTVGWTFTANSNLTVTQLGFYDAGQDGLASAHQVGIWSSGGTLLTSATVAAGNGATLDGGFRYVAIGGFALAAGATYTIGAEALEGPAADQYFFSPDSVSTDAAITFGSGVRSGDDSGFAFPDAVPNSGRFGPNFQFAAAVVPEPATWAMMIAGFGLAGAGLRRRSARIVYA